MVALMVTFNEAVFLGSSGCQLVDQLERKLQRCHRMGLQESHRQSSSALAASVLVWAVFTQIRQLRMLDPVVCNCQCVRNVSTV